MQDMKATLDIIYHYLDLFESELTLQVMRGDNEFNSWSSRGSILIKDQS